VRQVVREWRGGMMDKFQNMRIFAKVVETGSFTAAADFWGFNSAVVSRSIADLEAHLCTRLLNRSTRKMALTEAGERYLAKCLEILRLLDEAEGEARNANVRPRGSLRVHSWGAFGQHYIIPCVASYEEKYPDVYVDLTMLQRTPDLLEEGFDVSIVLAEELEDSALVAQQIGATASILCASPSFLQRHPSIERPEDLARLPCVELGIPQFSPNRWTLYRGEDEVTVGITGRLRVNVPESVAVAIEHGMGIGALPAYSAMRGLRDGTLVRVLPDYTLRPLRIYLLYASSRYLDAKIRTWVDHLKQSLPLQRAAEIALLTASPASSDTGIST
jgi:DNA-binding transcriptional LysR family regulator